MSYSRKFLLQSFCWFMSLYEKTYVMYTYTTLLNFKFRSRTTCVLSLIVNKTQSFSPFLLLSPSVFP